MQAVSQILSFTSKFETCEIPYMVTGSIAGIVYDEPQMTNDVDVILANMGEEINRAEITFLAEQRDLSEIWSECN